MTCDARRRERLRAHTHMHTYTRNEAHSAQPCAVQGKDVWGAFATTKKMHIESARVHTYTKNDEWGSFYTLNPKP